MLFNSFEFIFLFLPTTVIGFYLFGLFSRVLALRWLAIASLFFYAWWRPLNVLIIAPSVLVNFALARILQRLGENPERRLASKVVLLSGILFNIGFLGYFKYKNFFLGAINDVSGADFTLVEIILPLGISFITFQKLAFLVDVYGRRIESFHFQDYCLFVLFFPQLIAGPIVHYRELVPQFRDTSFGKMNVAIGLTLFSLGLFKKVVFADSIAPFVTPIYEQASSVGEISLFPAWMAAIGFTVQMYFDFSGYSDMAIGSAYFFGIRLPANFNSPLKATSIIDFWSRWHMTLTRFLTAYIYNPLLLNLTRRRLAKGRSGLGRKTTLGAFAGLLMFPTMLTMLVSGVWHGAGYLFVVWGLLHGIFLTINHAWRLLGARFGWKRQIPGSASSFAGFVLTFVSVVSAMVFFRSPTMNSAIALIKGMAGLSGVALPNAFLPYLGPFAQLWHNAGFGTDSWLGAGHFLQLSMWIGILMFVALIFPNTLQLLARSLPAQDVKPRQHSARIGVPDWNPSVAYALFVVAIVTVAIFHVGGESEFLYWQF